MGSQGAGDGDALLLAAAHLVGTVTGALRDVLVGKLWSGVIPQGAKPPWYETDAPTRLNSPCCQARRALHLVPEHLRSSEPTARGLFQQELFYLLSTDSTLYDSISGQQ
jgi:hypothetical protein